MSGKHTTDAEKVRASVRTMVAFGVPQKQICAALHMSWKTLNDNYREEIDAAAAIATSKVAQSLYNMACGSENVPPNVAAAIFWLKCRSGWKPARHDDAGGDDDEGNSEGGNGGMNVTVVFVDSPAKQPMTIDAENPGPKSLPAPI